jgi:hypothetical protein
MTGVQAGGTVVTEIAIKVRPQEYLGRSPIPPSSRCGGARMACITATTWNAICASAASTK